VWAIASTALLSLGSATAFPQAAHANLIDTVRDGLSDVVSGNGGLGGLLGDLLPSPMGSLFEDVLSGNFGLGSALEQILDISRAPGTVGEIADIFIDSSGELGFPDPQQALERVLAIALDGVGTETPPGATPPINSSDPSPQPTEPGDQDVYEIVNENREAIARAYVNRQLARADAQATLGEAGQSRTATTLQKLDSNLQTIGESAESAQGLTVTQDVMKAIAQQQAQAALIHGAMLKEQVVAQQQRAMTNQVLADISDSTDSQTRMMRADDLGDAAKLLRASGNAGLF
jgi:hypothetical protein